MRHLAPSELERFDFDPSPFVAFARGQGRPGLAAGLAKCRRAAWRCETYLAFEGDGKYRVTTLLLGSGGELLNVDLDVPGNAKGIEFMSRLPCKST